MWREWLKEVEGLVVTPCTEEESSCGFTVADRKEAFRACKQEQSMHRRPAQRQHLFTVSGTSGSRHHTFG
jgi:hypothetical protein